jgi:hypothetical protein
LDILLTTRNTIAPFMAENNPIMIRKFNKFAEVESRKNPCRYGVNGPYCEKKSLFGVSPSDAATAPVKIRPS